MILELLAAVIVVLLGAPLAVLAGLRHWAVAAFSPLLGAFVYMTVGALQVVLYLPTYPWLTLAVSVLVSGSVGFLVRRQFAGLAIPLIVSAASAGAIAAATFALALVKWTADSMVYLAVGGLLASDRYHDVPAPAIALERLVGVGLLHAPAHASGAIAVMGVTPVMAASALAVSAWMLATGAAGRAPRKHLAVATTLLVAAPLAANRMVFTAFYINGHVIVGCAVLLLAGSAWLVAAGRAPARLLAVAAVAIPAATVTRPDAAALLAVVLVGVVAEPRVRPRDRAILVATLGAAMFAWNAFLASTYMRVGLSVPREVLAQVAGGAVLLGLALVLLRPLSVLACSRIVRWSAIGLAAATVGAIAVRPEVAAKSVYATIVNMAYRGGWAPLLPLLAIAVIAALALFTLPEARVLTYAVLTFPAVALILAVVRDGAYRVGPGDSLNRSWAHIVPVALLLVTATVLLGRLRRASADSPDSGADQQFGDLDSIEGGTLTEVVSDDEQRKPSAAVD